MEQEMRFINYIKPTLQEGKYRVSVTQTLTEPEPSEYSGGTEFYVSGKAYAMSKEEVFSVFPADNESGEFADVLPFLVLEQRSYPWERKILPDKNGVPVPWVALIVVSEEESVVCKDITVAGSSAF